MPAARKDLYAFFDAHNIAYDTVEHPPIFTVAEGADIKASIAVSYTHLTLPTKA